MFRKNPFIGKYVQIYQKEEMEVSTQTQYNDGHPEVTTKIPLVVEGYVVRMDAEFVYLGSTPKHIINAVPRANVSLIEITEPLTSKAAQAAFEEKVPKGTYYVKNQSKLDN